MEEIRDRLIEYDFFISSMKRQMMNCVNKPHYKAGIYVDNWKKSKFILDRIQDILKEYSWEECLCEKHAIRNQQNEIKIIFKNSSSIIISKASICTRYRFNDVIYDHQITDNDVIGIILESPVPYCDYSANPIIKDESTRTLFRLVECEM